MIGQRAGTQARTPIEAIQEFQVLTHQFDAEFGRTTGAVINAVTKQGTNRFRGSAFSFFQDAALTTRDYFAGKNDLPKPDRGKQPGVRGPERLPGGQEQPGAAPRLRLQRGCERSVGHPRRLRAVLRQDALRADHGDLFMSNERNPGQRVDTSRTRQVVRVNPQFAASMLERVNLGRTDYDALELQFEKRLSRNYSVRVAYTLSYSRGNTSGAGIPQNLFQTVDDLRLDANEGPTDFDRRHNFVVSRTAIVPRTGGLTISWVARALGGLPFTLIDSTTDADRNGLLFDPRPAGTYTGSGPDVIEVEFDGGRNGAYGPNFFQLDTRIGYRLRLPGDRTLDMFGEIFNVTNRANFDNPITTVLTHPAADRRQTDFLALRALRPGAVPRMGQIGVRLGF